MKRGGRASRRAPSAPPRAAARRRRRRTAPRRARTRARPRHSGQRVAAPAPARRSGRSADPAARPARAAHARTRTSSGSRQADAQRRDDQREEPSSEAIGHARHDPRDRRTAPARLRQFARAAMTLAAVDYAWSLQPAGVIAVGARGRRSTAWRLRDLRRAPGARSGGRRRATRCARSPSRPASLVLLVALVSPIDTLGEERLFTVTWSSTCCSPTSRRSCCCSGSRRAFLRPAVRRLRPVEERARPARPPGRGAGRCYVGTDVALAPPGDVRAGARPPLGARARARDRSSPPGSRSGGS